MASTVETMIQWLASGAGKDAKLELAAQGQQTTVKVGGDLVKEPNAVARAVAKAVRPALVGTLPHEQAQVAQWQAWAASQEDVFAQAVDLNAQLEGRSYLVGSAPTLADVQLYFLLAKGVEQAFPGPLGGLVALMRYFDHVQHALRIGAFAAHNAGLLPKLVPMQSIYKPISMPVFQQAAKGGDKKTAAAAAPAAGGKEKPPQPPQGEKGAGKGGADKGGKDGGKAAKADGGKQKEGEGTGKGTGKGKGGGDAGAAGGEEDLGNPNLLDIRVGKILKAWKHPEAEKLYCEEIDVGEEAPRQIASGLRHFYADESELTGRKVLVLANLKPRALVGFKSHGMVLCASNTEHTEVKFVDVPASANVGDRVVFKGEGVEVVPPAEPNKLAKKKIFEAVAPGLCTDAKGVCNHKGVPFTIEASGEVCTAPLPNAHVS